MENWILYFIIYLVVINIVTFLVMGLDKWKAKRGSWRVQESALFTFVIFGGGIGHIEPDFEFIFIIF